MALRNRILACTTAALALAGAVPAASLGAVAGPVPADWSPTSEGIVWATLAPVEQYWAHYNVYPCPDVQVYTFPSLTEAGLGFFPDGPCAIAIAEGTLETIKINLTGGGWLARDAVTMLFCILAHERGHNAGLQHTPGTFMGTGTPPVEARMWANQLYPKQTKVKRRKVTRTP